MAKKPPKQMGEKVSLGYAWYALGVLFMINLINYVDRLSIGPAMEHLKRDFSATDAQMGLIAGSFMLVYAVLSLPMGYLSDKGKRTKIIALGAAVWSVATTFSGFCRGFMPFFSARAAVGAGEGIYAPSGTAIVTDYFPKRLRNTSIAIFMSAMIVGGAIAYIVAGIILQKTDKYNIPAVTNILVPEGQDSVDGWKLEGVEDPGKCRVMFTFRGPDGTGLTAILGKGDKKEEADFHSSLFNVDYKQGELDDPAEFAPAAAALVETLNARLTEREVIAEVNGDNLEEVEAPITSLPFGLAKGEVVSEKEGKVEYRLVFTGELENKEKGTLQKIFDFFGGKKDEGDGKDPIVVKKELLEKFGGLLTYSEMKMPEVELTAGQKIGKSLSKLVGHGAHDDGIERTMIFKGILGHDDKLELAKLSDNESYQKCIGELYTGAKYHFLRSDNWRWIFWILGPPGLILALFAFFLKEPLKGGSEDFLSEEEAQRVEEQAKSDYSMLYKTPSLVLMIFSNILATFCVGGLNAWLFPFVERYKGVESAVAAVQFGPVVVIFAVLGVIFSGIAADKLQKKTLHGNNIIIVAGIILGIPPMYVFLNASADNYLLLVGSISLCIFFLTWINGPMNALLMSLVEPRLRALLNGVHILLIHLLGDAISPFIIGSQSDIRGLQFALSLLPLVLAVSAIGFGIASIFVPKDLKAVEKRMKELADAGVNLDVDGPVGH